jgi:NADH dehydrogenase
MTEVIEIIPSTNSILTNDGIFEYDMLVLATGCKTNFFNNPQIERFAFPLKTTYDAISIRNHIIHTFEKVLSANPNELKGLLNLIIVGAGPTGVELAGAFAEIKKYVLPKDYPGIDFSELSIYLIEGSNRVLVNMSEKAGITSGDYLEKMGVKLLTQRFVKNYDGEIVVLSDGTVIPSKTVIWAAGVIGNKINGLPESNWIANNRIKVDRNNKVQGFENIYALGDLAFMETPLYPKGHPQVANVAINQAKLLAKNLKRLSLKKQLLTYEYKDLGSMATIGRNKAVVDLPFVKFQGYFAWLIWMFLHLMLILSVKNKLIIFINWAWNYLTKNSSLRLILKAEDR